jgi:hypothetical protein
MIGLNWLPWRAIVSRLAKSRGLVDPINVLSRLESFGQPIEIREPLELLRAGLVFHRRGLMNAAAIQHNLDWVWPFWVERQYDPRDIAFIPRAFSITHINLSHRNWTAIGLPGRDSLPIVDPRGLVTPFWDGWSIDAWIVERGGRQLLPSRLENVEQYLQIEDMSVVTHSVCEGLDLHCRVNVEESDGSISCRMRLAARGSTDAFLVIALRPFNPEGVSFVHQAGVGADEKSLIVDGRSIVFDTPPSQIRFSDYRRGDVHARLFEADLDRSIECRVGMVSAAALFSLRSSDPVRVEATIPLNEAKASRKPLPHDGGWPLALDGRVRLRVPDRRIQFLYEAAIRTLVLHSPGEVFAGPYTYKRFWFRDATFIMHALLCAGLADRVERSLEQFWPRQTRAGFFLSQEGEWDSNGQALWIIQRYCELTGRSPDHRWKRAIRRAADWLMARRLRDVTDEPHAGLLPAGFSAEHLGPNDYYYWDDFWGVAGLRAAASLLDELEEPQLAGELREEATAFLDAIGRSLAGAASTLARPGMPASPYRRMDSGAIGSLAAGYPLQVFPPRDPRLLETARYLVDECFVAGGFFLDMIHSGINAYLTLHIAQVLLRAGDTRALDIMQAVADLASPTGQWPEAIHPATRGGCMGDGHHAWAAAEWSLFIRNSFVREEGDRLILGSGIPRSWLIQAESFSMSAAPTPFGDLSISIQPRAGHVEIEWSCAWRRKPSGIEVRLPGFEPAHFEPDETPVKLSRGGVA